MMTKKNYKMIATIVLSLTDDRGIISKEALVQRLSDYFERDNPKFDTDSFRRACTMAFPGGVL